MKALMLFLVVALALPSHSARGEQSVYSQAAFDEAMTLKAAGRLLEAERKLVEALGEEPGNAAYQFELANIYAARYDIYKQNRYDKEALETLERVERELENTVMLRPGYIPAQFNLAVVHKRQGKYEEAREQFKRVLEEARAQGDAATEIRAVMQIGASYEEQGFYLEALDYYKEARNLDYGNIEIRAAIEEIKERQAKNSPPPAAAGALPGSSFGLFAGRERVPYGHGSALGRYTEDLRQANSGNAAQVIPFIGAMLAQQFMNRNRKDKDELFR